MGGILLYPLKQDSCSCLKLQKTHCKTFRLKYIKSEGRKSHLDSKEECTEFRKIHRKTPAPESLFEWSCRPQACNFIKIETLVPRLSREFCEIFKNTFFTEHIRAIAFQTYLTHIHIRPILHWYRSQSTLAWYWLKWRAWEL